LNSEVVGCGVFYVVSVVSNTKYVVRLSRQLVIPWTSCIFQNKESRLKIGYALL
jgi:hypothetical protein